MRADIVKYDSRAKLSQGAKTHQEMLKRKENKDKMILNQIMKKYKIKKMENVDI